LLQCASDSEDGDVVLRCELSGFLRAGFCGLITEGSSIFKAEQLVYYVMPGLLPNRHTGSAKPEVITELLTDRR
jgi:hypothetical protein